MVDSELAKIIKPVNKEMQLFQQEYTEVLQSKVELINKICKYLLSQDSKKIRPVILFLAAKLCGEPTEQTMISASCVEILHTATLIHDDIVDRAEIRRGKPSINSVWKNKIAVLMGDFLFSRSLTEMIKLHNFETLELLSATTELLSSGEILQIEKSNNDGMDENIYYEMIYAKTASLFASSCKIGASSVKAGEKEQTALFNYGKYLGMAFQIKDDIFDYTGSSEKLGKPVGRDVKSNLLTLPLIITLNNIPGSEQKRWKKLLKKKLSVKNVKKINELVKESGGVEYTEKKLNSMSESAIEELSIFPESEIKQSLIDLVSFNKKREK